MNELLKKFNMGDAKEMKTPMHSTTYLGLDEESKKMGGTQYRAMIRFLLCLTASKLDIMFSVCLCERFHKEPREVHVNDIKGIFRYLISTPNLCHCFKRGKDFKLSSYCDANYAGDKLERKSTSRSCLFIGGNLVTWIFKNQGSVAFHR